MSGHGSVTHWIRQLKAGDDAAVQQQLWDRYFERLIRLARSRLRSLPQRDADEEDVVLSALNSFFDGIRRGRFPQLADRMSLWPLLVKITARKSYNQLRRQRAARRGGGRVQDELEVTGPGADDYEGSIERVVGDEPTPAFAAEVADECQRLLEILDDESLRTVAILKIQEFTNAEIAKELNVSQRTVERKLRIIRQQWSEEYS